MASEYHIKKANHRQQMEMMDQLHRHQVRSQKDRQKKEMAELRNRHGIQKSETQQTQKNQLETLKQKHDTFVQQERLNHQARLEKQKLQEQKDYQKAAAEKARENARLRQAAQIEKERYVALRDQARQATMEKEVKTEQQLEEMDKEGRIRLKQQQAQYQERERSLQQGHNREVHNIEQAGQQRAAEKRNKFEKINADQNQTYNQELQRDKQHFEGVKQRQHNYYHKKLDEDEQFFQDQLKLQRKEYTGRYQDNERFIEASFENQENRLQEELFKIKRDFISTAQFYEDRKQDPFYSLVDFGAKFTEGEAFYEVTAEIPEHEMKNVRVHVQPNKISIQAARQHEQEFKKDNEKIGSNIAQTIRQEFDLSKTADADKVVKTYKDGVLTVVVPKKGFYQFGQG